MTSASVTGWQAIPPSWSGSSDAAIRGRPGDMATFSRVWFSTDARSALPTIQVPTSVIVRTGWPPDLIEESQWTADQIPGAHLVRVPGDEDDPYLGDVVEVAGAVKRFADSIDEERAVFDRVLATVLFTDMVGSIGARGDRAEIGSGSDSSSSTTRRCGRCSRGSAVRGRHGGRRVLRDVRRTGPRGALRRCDSRESVGWLGIHVRAGVHTGEVETIDGKAGGAAVVIGARIGGLAGPSEILSVADRAEFRRLARASSSRTQASTS